MIFHNSHHTNGGVAEVGCVAFNNMLFTLGGYKEDKGLKTVAIQDFYRHNMETGQWGTRSEYPNKKGILSPTLRYFEGYLL